MERWAGQIHAHLEALAMGAKSKPSRAELALFTATLRVVDDESLVELRRGFVGLAEHPDGIAALDREVARRKRAIGANSFW